MTDQEVREALEHREVLEALRAILVTAQGQRFFLYLFKHFEVAEPPVFGLEGNLLMDKLGFLRAGSSIFQLVAEANPELAGALLAKKEKERHAALYQEALEQG